MMRDRELIRDVVIGLVFVLLIGGGMLLIALLNGTGSCS